MISPQITQITQIKEQRSYFGVAVFKFEIC